MEEKYITYYLLVLLTKGEAEGWSDKWTDGDKGHGWRHAWVMKGETDNEEIDVREGDGERHEGSKYGRKKKGIKGKMKEE